MTWTSTKHRRVHELNILQYIQMSQMKIQYINWRRLQTPYTAFSCSIFRSYAWIWSYLLNRYNFLHQTHGTGQTFTEIMTKFVSLICCKSEDPCNHVIRRAFLLGFVQLTHIMIQCCALWAVLVLYIYNTDSTMTGLSGARLKCKHLLQFIS